MSLREMPYKPGVVTDDPAYSSQGYAVSSDKIRWVRGHAESLPGYVDAASGARVSGRARGAPRTWVDNAGISYAAIGTSRKLYVLQSGVLYDITPIRSSGQFGGAAISVTAGSNIATVALAAHGCREGDTIYLGAIGAVGGVEVDGGSGVYSPGPFSVTAGTGLVTIEAPAHGASTGDLLTLANASPVGGLTLAGQYTVSVLDADHIQVDAGTPATSTAQGGGTPSWSLSRGYVVHVVDLGTLSVVLAATAAATASGGNGGTWACELQTGNDTGVPSGGYGAGGFGVGEFGASPDPAHLSDIVPRTWSLDNFGQTLLANPIGGTIYQWVPDLSQRAVPCGGTCPQVVDSILCTPERYLLALGCTTSDQVTYDPLTVRWASNSSTTDWLATATNDAGSFRVQTGSRIVRGIVARNQSLLLTDTALFAITDTGSIDQVYSFVLAGTTCGAIGPDAVVQADGSIWWMSPNGIYTWTGGSASQTACPVRKHAYGLVRPGQEYSVAAAWDADYSAVSFHLPGGDGTGGTTLDDISNYVRLDTISQVTEQLGWSIGTSDMTAWATRSPGMPPLSVRLDGLVAMQEKGTSAAGASVPRHVEWAPVDLPSDTGSGDHVLNVSRVVLDANVSGALAMTLSARYWPNGDASVKGPYAMTQATRHKDVRVQGRQVAVRFDSSSDADSWRMGVIRYDISGGPLR